MSELNGDDLNLTRRHAHSAARSTPALITKITWTAGHRRSACTRVVLPVPSTLKSMECACVPPAPRRKVQKGRMTTRPPCRDRRQLLASTTGSSEGRQRASRLITLFVQLLNPPRDLFERWKKRPLRIVEAFITQNDAFLRTRERGRIDNGHAGWLSVRREPPGGEPGDARHSVFGSRVRANWRIVAGP